MLSSYVTFTFDKSLLKKLYQQEKEPNLDNLDPTTGQKRTDEAEMLHRIYNRKPYSHGYCWYLMIYLISNLCCCFTRWCKGYESRLKSYKRLMKARSMITADIDIESYVMMRRLTNLLIKVVLKPH